MSLVRYSSYFSKSEQFKEVGGDKKNILNSFVEETLNEIEELIRTNECYKQRGKEAPSKNPNSPNISQKGASTKTKHRSSGLC
jgi:hypothetical protein